MPADPKACGWRRLCGPGLPWLDKRRGDGPLTHGAHAGRKLTESEVVPSPTLWVVRRACTGTGTHTTLARPNLNQSESLCRATTFRRHRGRRYYEGPALLPPAQGPAATAQGPALLRPALAVAAELSRATADAARSAVVLVGEEVGTDLIAAVADLSIRGAGAELPIALAAASFGIAGVDDAERVGGAGVSGFEAVPRRPQAGGGVEAGALLADEACRTGVAAASAIGGILFPGALVDALAATAGPPFPVSRQAARACHDSRAGARFTPARDAVQTRVAGDAALPAARAVGAWVEAAVAAADARPAARQGARARRSAVRRADRDQASSADAD